MVVCPASFRKQRFTVINFWRLYGDGVKECQHTGKYEDQEQTWQENQEFID
jgi:hypothetical protein